MICYYLKVIDADFSWNDIELKICSITAIESNSKRELTKWSRNQLQLIEARPILYLTSQIPEEILVFRALVVMQ